MSRFRLSFLLALAILFGAHSALATTFAVGSCRPSLTSFPTISAAVSSPLTVGATILVCPGTYAEQVIINQPLTLQGISSGNSNQAVITMPGGGLATLVTPVGATAAPEVEVAATAGPVNIVNLTVDGTGGDPGCTALLAGIYYGSGSTGTVNEVTTRNQAPGGCGFGILAENGTATNEPVTIENSSVHDFDDAGIAVASNQSPSSITATIKGNYIDVSLAPLGTGIDADINSLGSVTGNIVTGPGQVGILASSPVTISGNAVTGAKLGIATAVAGVTVTANKIASSASAGIDILASGVTFKSNAIFKSPIGIEFNCTTSNTISGNVIDDAPIGLDAIPFVTTTPPETFFNVGTIRNNTCGFAKSPAKQFPSLLGPQLH